VVAWWALHCIKTGSFAAAANILVVSPRRGHIKETWHICMGRDTNWLVTTPMNWVMTDMRRDSWVLTYLKVIPDMNKSRLKKDLEPCCQFENKKVSFTGLFSSCLAPTKITRSFNNCASPRSHKTTCLNPAHKGDTGNNTANTPPNKGHVMSCASIWSHHHLVLPLENVATFDSSSVTSDARWRQSCWSCYIRCCGTW